MQRRLDVIEIDEILNNYQIFIRDMYDVYFCEELQVLTQMPLDLTIEDDGSVKIYDSSSCFFLELTSYLKIGIPDHFFIVEQLPLDTKALYKLFDHGFVIKVGTKTGNHRPELIDEIENILAINKRQWTLKNIIHG